MSNTWLVVTNVNDENSKVLFRTFDYQWAVNECNRLVNIDNTLDVCVILESEYYE